jgi:hypothetical protein
VATPSRSSGSSKDSVALVGAAHADLLLPKVFARRDDLFGCRSAHVTLP